MSEHNDSERPYVAVAKQIEDLFKQHGDTHQGLGYPKGDGYRRRQQIFLDVMRFGPGKPERPRLLEIGCATGILLDHHQSAGLDPIDYKGVDLSETMVRTARVKHPNAEFHVADPFDHAEVWLPKPDYVIMGSIFTWRPGVSECDMWDYMLRLVGLAFEHCSVGVAFNVMSKHVDWEREDLFHVPFDDLAAMLRKHVGRNFLFRSDYGLYEYTTYVYR